MSVDGIIKILFSDYYTSHACVKFTKGIVIVTVVEEPEFTDVIQNVTVPAGRSVRLACSVKNLGSYKVALIVSR